MLLMKLVWFCSVIYLAKTFDIEITDVERMPPEMNGIMDMSTIRLVKKGRNEFKISGTVHVYKNIGDEVKVSCDFGS